MSGRNSVRLAVQLADIPGVTLSYLVLLRRLSPREKTIVFDLCSLDICIVNLFHASDHLPFNACRGLGGVTVISLK